MDKIIIDQESTGEFVNSFCPGAFTSFKKTDFKAMDDLELKPLGIYGSKSEIIRFFRELNTIDRNTYASRLLKSDIQSSSTSTHSLREALLQEPQNNIAIKPAGLYAFATQSNGEKECRVYVIFRPEETTWDDDANPVARSHRATFTRYAFRSFHASGTGMVQLPPRRSSSTT